MNYYEEIIAKIEKYLDEKDYLNAFSLINNELNVPYVPKSIEDKLIGYLEECNAHIRVDINDDKNILEYLNGDDFKKAIGVKLLCTYDLNEYLKEVEDFLCDDNPKELKVLLVDALINQEVNEEIKMIQDGIEYDFIPKYIIPIENCDGFIEGLNILNEAFIKNPSYLKMGKELLFEKIIMYLPLNVESEEGKDMAYEIINYIFDCFDDEEGRKEWECFNSAKNEVFNSIK